MWLADDGKVPTHLPHLTPKLASQITQVWAVTFKTPQQVLQGVPPPGKPDYDPPLYPSPNKRARHAQDHNLLHYGNVTHLGRQVIDGYWTREPGFIFAEPILIHSGAVSTVSTLPSEEEQSLELRRGPIQTTQEHMEDYW